MPEAHNLFYVDLSCYTHGEIRPFHHKSTCLAQLTFGPNVVQIWSRSTLKCRENETLTLHRVECHSGAEPEIRDETEPENRRSSGQKLRQPWPSKGGRRLWITAGLFLSKVDRLVPQSQHVNLRIVPRVHTVGYNPFMKRQLEARDRVQGIDKAKAAMAEQRRQAPLDYSR